MAQAWNPSTQEAGAGRLQAPHMPGPRSEFCTSETLFQRKKGETKQPSLISFTHSVHPVPHQKDGSIEALEKRWIWNGEREFRV